MLPARREVSLWLKRNRWAAQSQEADDQLQHAGHDNGTAHRINGSTG
jgi:hypothetical protein